MAWFDDGDGWRNEDSEGPYCTTLRTKDGFTIAEYLGDPGKFYLTGNDLSRKGLLFASIDSAKRFVENMQLTN